MNAVTILLQWRVSAWTSKALVRGFVMTFPAQDQSGPLTGHEDASFRFPEDCIKSLIDLIPYPVVVLDDWLTIICTNACGASLLGYTTEELSGMCWGTVFPQLAAPGGESPAEVGSFGDEPSARGEMKAVVARRKDGGCVAVSIKNTRCPTELSPAWTLVFIEQVKAGRDEELGAHPARMSELEFMTGGVAHEIRQPLTAILSNAEAAQRILGMDVPNLSELREAMADIADSSFRANEIVRTMQQLARRAPPDTLPLDMGNLVRSVVRRMRRDAAVRNIQMTLDVVPDLPVVHCNNIQLQQVMTNLLTNAFDAVEGCSAEDRVVSVAVMGALDGSGVSIAVSDRGLVLSTEQIGRSFTPYITSKAHGLGLGLPISSTIIAMHGGRLWAESNGERGAVFHILLPAWGTEEETGSPRNS
ncbi:sensor histidine kinase [Paraburkholderia kirstenboschensis]|uniref:sensor histidine kinase n=1 Tax=Paraburkholderia kirstenboschensis TaxID=1245436 RepID=UPI001F2A736F|nr:ATP-binding protein [Paraburkholderia kirstenboschensis]